MKDATTRAKSGPRVLNRKGEEVPDRRSPIEPMVLGAITNLM